MQEEKPVLVTIDEAARLLNVHRVRVHQFVKGGRLFVAGKDGKRILLNREQVLNLERGHKKGKPHLTLGEWEETVAKAKRPRDTGYGTRPFWLTVPHVAKMLGVSEVMVRYLIVHDKLEARKVPGGGAQEHWEIAEESVLTYRRKKQEREEIKAGKVTPKGQQKRLLAQWGYASEAEQKAALNELALAVPGEQERKELRELAQRMEDMLKRF